MESFLAIDFVNQFSFYGRDMVTCNKFQFGTTEFLCYYAIHTRVDPLFDKDNCDYNVYNFKRYFESFKW